MLRTPAVLPSRPEVLHSVPDSRRCTRLHTDPHVEPTGGGNAGATDAAAVRCGGRSMQGRQCAMVVG